MDPLLEPLTINGVTLKNRIFTTAHAPMGFVPESGIPDERYVRYLEEKAIGGQGLIMFGGSSFVSADSHSHFGAFDAGVDEIVPWYQTVADRLHAHGAKAMVQISHLGRRADDRVDFLPTIAPSPIRERAHRSFPKPMEDHDFTRVLRAYAAAARRARDGGLDGVEIAAMSGHLPDTFIAPRANHRDDEYGGSFENRMRFLLQVVDTVRTAVGPDFLVAIRIPGREASTEGLSGDECVAIARRLSETKQLDFFNVMYGSGFTHRELGRQIPSAGTPLGAYLPVAERIRAAVAEPVFHAGRIADIATARYALREGLIDMVGMTRAHIADPHIVRKLEVGEEHRIRPCVGASFCLNGREMQCIHNPATGRESFIPQLITRGTQQLRVVVVGGGAAGLEAARVAAERGHDVSLFEAGSQVGGQVLTLSRTHRNSEKRSITEWLAEEAKLAGARIKLGAFVDGADVLAENPQVVIVASGGMPNTALPEGGDDLVETASDVLNMAPPTGKSILIYDDHGGEQALVVAEHLASGEGNQIEFATYDEAAGHDVGHTVIAEYRKILYKGGVNVTPDQELRGAKRAGGKLTVTLRNTMTDEITTRVVDRVVVEQGNSPFVDVYDELRDQSSNRGEIDLEAFVTGAAQPGDPDAPTDSFRLYRVGDALSHRGIHAAIFDARRLCMNL
ncbi:oxidoreductase [Rhodococcoides kyotonense]|uniref:2,4-dienoyl-CoA reductase n=1 Tax=Rhodococcoides kyotonense TaxID=398843 RepID=A0A239M139_9NOCA|nr:NAD(P)-binding protein [Rhodococcus kyotonensis]SNT35629.1 2,4-dienoyl-CoA reductase [Rhodococcus kyotonensis]